MHLILELPIAEVDHIARGGELTQAGPPHSRRDPVTAIVFQLKSSVMSSFDEKNH